MKEYPCSHKAQEWREYESKKVEGDGLFPPNGYCRECEESRKLKAISEERSDESLANTRLSEEPKYISRIDPDGKRRVYDLDGKAVTDERSWEGELAQTLMQITAEYQTWNYAMNLYHPLKDFVSKAISEAESRMIASLIPEIEKMKKEIDLLLPTDSVTVIGQINYNKALDEVIKLIQSRSELGKGK